MSPAGLNQPLTLALSKGRIFDETLPLLEDAGIKVLESPETSRKLILSTNNPDLRLIIVRATDVPTYVQYGAADLGVAGRDLLAEHGGEGLYQPLDLGIAHRQASAGIFALVGVAELGAEIEGRLAAAGLAGDPSNALVLYGTTAEGVEKSIDGGETWNPANTGLPAGGSVSAIAIA